MGWILSARVERHLMDYEVELGLRERALLAHDWERQWSIVLHQEHEWAQGHWVIEVWL